MPVTIGLALAPPVFGQNIAEQYLVFAANQQRSARGLPALQVDSELSRLARAYAEQALASGIFSPQARGQADLMARLNQSGERYEEVAELVESSATPYAVQQDWMMRGGDRKHLLDPAWNTVGVAVLSSPGGLIAVEDLGHRIETLSSGSGSLNHSPRSFGEIGAPQSISQAESYLFEAANRERERYQLTPLQWDDGLAGAAAAHASAMASHRGISHQFEGEPELSERGASANVRFTRISENVAEAPTAAMIHEAWMRSPGHRENILDPKVDIVGMSVVVRDGQLYAAQDFAHLTPKLSLNQQESTVGQVLDVEGLELLPGDDQVRRACAADSGYPGSQAPGFIMRYTTDDLGKLPERLRRVLGDGTYRHAMVGACSGQETSSFTSYRIAILLYP